MKPVYVIGHKNPDLDSIAAAIAYKVFKQSTDQGIYIAAAAGDLNEESKYILDYLGFDLPLQIKDVRAKVEDILEEEDVIHISADLSLLELSNIMRQHELKTVPVLDDNKKFLGLITIGDMAMIYMNALGSGREIENSPEILRKILGQRVSEIMKTRDLVLFEKDESVEEAKKMMLSTRFRNYPVVDGENRYMGIISRYNLLKMKRKQLILVDHNEKKQAVDGIEEAEIIEIIDHHRVGDLQTIQPILFYNEPIGSTCTLVAERFFANQIMLTEKLAALLLAGIMSDTMIFKSPTTTAKDKRIVAELEKISGFRATEWGKKIFEKTCKTDLKSDEEIISEDIKEYVSGDTIFAIAQAETVDMQKINQRKNELIEKMNELCAKKSYALMCLMITDIFEEGTELMIAGEKAKIAENAFGQDIKDHSVFLKGVMSRKKQVVPVLFEAIRKETLI